MAAAKDAIVKSIVEGDKTADDITKAVKLAMSLSDDSEQTDEELEKLCDEALTEDISLMRGVRRPEV